jgi:hypothetical protein
MPRNPAAIGSECAALLRHLAPREQPPGFCIGDVKIAQLGNRLGLSRRTLFRRGISAIENCAEDGLGPDARFVWGQNAVSPDYLPALAAVRCSILDVVGDRRSALPPGAEPSGSGIPHDFIGAERPYLAQTDPLPLVRHRDVPRRWLVAGC